MYFSNVLANCYCGTRNQFRRSKSKHRPSCLKPDRTDAFRSFNTQRLACRFQNTVQTCYISVLPKLETEQKKYYGLHVYMEQCHTRRTWIIVLLMSLQSQQATPHDRCDLQHSGILKKGEQVEHIVTMFSFFVTMLLQFNRLHVHASWQTVSLPLLVSFVLFDKLGALSL